MSQPAEDQINICSVIVSCAKLPIMMLMLRVLCYISKAVCTPYNQLYNKLYNRLYCVNVASVIVKLPEPITAMLLEWQTCVCPSNHVQVDIGAT